MARRSTPERSSTGVLLVVDQVKTGGKADNSGTPRSDMSLERDTESLKHLEPMRKV